MTSILTSNIDRVETDPASAAEFADWCASIEGWDDDGAPKFAEHPLQFCGA